MVENSQSEKIILEIEDLKKIKPNYQVINILTKETCEKVQVLIFDKQENVLKILTTNNFSDSLKKWRKSFLICI